MKNFITTFLLFVSLNSFAQTFKYDSIHNGVGIKAGLNYSILSGSINNDMTYKTGLMFGLFIQGRISKSSAFVPEIIFSRQGCKNKYVDNYGVVHGESTLYLDYVSFPLLFKTYIVKGLNIQYGPQIGILFTAREKGTEYIYDYSSSGPFSPKKIGEKPIDEVFEKEFNAAEFLLVGGIGYDFPFRMKLSVRLSKGITNIMKPEHYKIITGQNLSNVVFQFSLGYVFPVKY